MFNLSDQEDCISIVIPPSHMSIRILGDECQSGVQPRARPPSYLLPKRRNTETRKGKTREKDRCRLTQRVEHP